MRQVIPEYRWPLGQYCLAEVITKFIHFCQYQILPLYQFYHLRRYRKLIWVKSEVVCLSIGKQILKNNYIFLDVCQLPQVHGPCKAAHRRWYYDSSSRDCREFLYGGCRGNENRFMTRAECLIRCGSDGKIVDNFSKDYQIGIH